MVMTIILVDQFLLNVLVCDFFFLVCDLLGVTEKRLKFNK